LITGLAAGLPAKDGLAAVHRESEQGRTVGKISITMP